MGRGGISCTLEYYCFIYGEMKNAENPKAWTVKMIYILQVRI